ncbi:scavenger receptor cysteine-rich domain-containing protein DMBT1-like [Diadema setosum]|uniref:scavenger receptor cysteine-rich domain-containing protein DMBT1-like n=1 Tax=Diadema setosum TaxID=31175 RepID=UPI003B3B8275
MNTYGIMENLANKYMAIVSLLMTMHLQLVTSSKDGAIRLWDGGYEYQGALQIFHKNAWGTVCSQGWDFQDAEVACRQLGYPGASLSNTKFVTERPEGDVWLKDVHCKGNEESLLDCNYEGWMIDDEVCLHGPFVQIQCRVSGYLGCADVIEGSSLMVGTSIIMPNVTATDCIASCRRDGFPYAAVQAPEMCVCGTLGDKPTFEGGDHVEKCNQTCPGDRFQICGGQSSMNVYDVEQGSCGGKYSGKNVSISSPGFPGKYPPGFTCRWEADVSGNSYTTIRLPVLDLVNGDQLTITVQGEKFVLGHASSFEKRVAQSISKVKVEFTSASDSMGGGGFVLTLLDDSYCPDVEVNNGSLVLDNDVMYRPGEEVEVDCESGFMPYRHMTACQKNGHWHPEPRCVEFNKWTSWEFRKTVLFIAVIAVSTLFLMFMLTICYLLCGDTKRKKKGFSVLVEESRYYGINTDSGEPHAHDGEASPNKDEYKAVGMEDPGMVDEEGREASIPLASEVDV